MIKKALLTVVGLGLIIGLPIALGRILPGEEALGLVGLLLLAGGVTACVLQWRKEYQAVAATLAITAVTFSVSLFGLAAVPVGRHQNSASLVDVATKNSTATFELATFHHTAPSVVYYAGRPVDQFFDAERVRQFFRDSAEPFVIADAAHYDELKPILPGDVVVLARQRRFLKEGELLLLGRVPQAARQRGTERRG